MMTRGYLEICREDICSLFPPIPRRANKGSMGRVLLICGSYDGTGSSMCGAAYFSASAAYRCGAGIAQIYTHRKNYEALAALIPEAVFTLYDTDVESETDICSRLSDEIKKADSVVLGCGLGRSSLAKALVKTTLVSINVPLLIDADGLNIISEDTSLWSLLSDSQRKRTVITPHMGEMSRLCGKAIPEILVSPVDTATEFAKGQRLICLLKDHKTVITDGETTFINNSGNAGMATGGMGDILSGIIGALLARETVADWTSDERLAISSVLYRAATSAYLHGLAGDSAAERLGEYSLTASDVLGSIAEAIAGGSRTHTPYGEQFSRLSPNLALQDLYLASTRFD